jgi:DNA-binding FrmR family transcriptional regulator
MTMRFVLSGYSLVSGIGHLTTVVDRIPTGVYYYQGQRWIASNAALRETVGLAHVIRDKNKLLNRVRRIKGQLDAVERSLDEGAECSDILHTIAACRGAIDGLMAEVIEGHIRFHVVDPDHHPTSERAKAAQELIDVIKMYMK